MNTLNGTQTRKGLENHICPLQIDIVFDPFGGLMTVPSRALALNRKGRASELSTPYFFDGVKHMQAAERKVEMPTWFDVEEIG